MKRLDHADAEMGKRPMADVFNKMNRGLNRHVQHNKRETRALELFAELLIELEKLGYIKGKSAEDIKKAYGVVE